VSSLVCWNLIGATFRLKLCCVIASDLRGHPSMGQRA
jgi:hypothetical protein